MYRWRTVSQKAIHVWQPDGAKINVMAGNGFKYFVLVGIDNEMGVDAFEAHVGPRLALDADAGGSKLARHDGRVGTLLPAEETVAGAVVRCGQRQGARRLGG